MDAPPPSAPSWAAQRYGSCERPAAIAHSGAIPQLARALYTRAFQPFHAFSHTRFSRTHYRRHTRFTVYTRALHVCMHVLYVCLTRAHYTRFIPSHKTLTYTSEPHLGPGFFGIACICLSELQSDHESTPNMLCVFCCVYSSFLCTLVHKKSSNGSISASHHPLKQGSVASR